MYINKTPVEIQNLVFSANPELEQFSNLADKNVKQYKGSMQPYQAYCLYNIFKALQPSKILEIGTGVGYSTAYIAKACQHSKIITLNPNKQELEIAQNYHNILGLSNIEYVCKTSDEYYRFIKLL